MRAELKPNLVETDSFLGKQGQRLFIYVALTNDAARDMLDRYGLQGKFIPLLLLSDGTVVDTSQKIVIYLKQNGMA